MNTAPDWFVGKSAEFLGQTVLLLKDYEGLSLRFGKDFFSTKTVCRKIWQYKKEVAKAKNASEIDIVPICLDVITSYVFSSPSCATGEIDADGLKKYIREFTEKFPLTEYDIKAMPYVLYFWHCMCNYRPDELADIPDSYKAIAKLINNFLNWLYDHIEELSEQLIE